MEVAALLRVPQGFVGLYAEAYYRCKDCEGW